MGASHRGEETEGDEKTKTYRAAHIETPEIILARCRQMTDTRSGCLLAFARADSTHARATANYSMNAAFKSLSDLVADAEDLLARIGHSQTPEVRALMDTVRVSIERMNEQLRRRARRLPLRGGLGRSWTWNPWMYLAAGASLAIGVAAWRRLRPGRQS
jgi:hypothetical protein